MKEFWDWLVKNPTITAALIAAFIGTFFTGLFWPAIKSAISAIYDTLKAFVSGKGSNTGIWNGSFKNIGTYLCSQRRSFL